MFVLLLAILVTGCANIHSGLSQNIQNEFIVGKVISKQITDEKYNYIPNIFYLKGYKLTEYGNESTLKIIPSQCEVNISGTIYIVNFDTYCNITVGDSVLVDKNGEYNPNDLSYDLPKIFKVIK